MKKIIYSIAFLALNLFNTYSAIAQEFITRWDMNLSSGMQLGISFEVETTGPVNYSWETIPAGNSGSGFFNGTSATITGFPAYSVIRLKIDTTNFRRININFNNDRKLLVDIEHWGGVSWSNMQTAFSGCINLNISATDIPNLSSVTNFSEMFSNCHILNSIANINNWDMSNAIDVHRMFGNAKVFNQPIGNWNTGNITDMSGMFAGAFAFNQPIGNWNTSNVTNMGEMFNTDTAFNQPIGNWNTSNVLYMNGMFSDAISFNQPIGNWNISNVVDMSKMFQMFPIYLPCLFNQPIENWNTSNVYSMQFMFNGNASFNKPIGNWDVSNVSSMEGMFMAANSFNQPLGNWSLKSTGVTVDNLLANCGMDCSNYSSTLNGWSNNSSTPNNLVLGSLGRYYGMNVIADRNNLISSKGWIINGDAVSSGVCLFYPTELNHNFIEDLKISPNPTHSVITISNRFYYNNATLKIISITGQVLFEQNNITSKVVAIDISHLVNGIYYLEVNNDNIEYRTKLLKN